MLEGCTNSLKNCSTFSERRSEGRLQKSCYLSMLKNPNHGSSVEQFFKLFDQARRSTPDQCPQSKKTALPSLFIPFILPIVTRSRSCKFPEKAH